MISYDTLPFKTFHQIMMDQEKNLHLLGIEDRKEAKKAWESIKDQWSERHPSVEEQELLPAYKNALTRTIELAKLIAALKFMLLFTDVSENRQKEVFKEARIRWADDPLDRIKAMNRMLSKAKVDKEYHDGLLKKVVSKIEAAREDQKAAGGKMSVSDINKSIASLEMAGFNIENYETLTCGKYDAMSAVIREQNQKQKQNGSR